MKRRLERVAGFTLVELLVVISIILLLTAASIPALQAFRRGQRLDQSARIVQSAISDARRQAVTVHARHVIVLYSYVDQTSEVAGTVESVRHALRVYRSPVGDPSWPAGYHKGGYVGDPVILPPGIRFDQRHMKSFQVFGPVTDPSVPLDMGNAYFNTGAGSKAIGIRVDGTFDYDATLDEPAVNASAGSRNIYQPDEGVYQVPDVTKADIVIGDFTGGLSGGEVLVKGFPRRALIDLQPQTGRATAVVFQIGDSFQPPPGGAVAH